MLVSENSVKTVVHVIYSGLGGHAAVTFSLLEAGFLVKARHHVVLAGVESPLQDYTDRLDRMGITWSYVRKIPRRGYLRFFRQLRKNFASQDPDLLFLNGLAASPAAVALSWSLGGRRPKVILRESEPVQLKGAYEWLLLALAHRTMNQIVHLTPEAAQSAKKRLMWLHREQKVTIIPNGLDTTFFRRNPRSVEDGIIRIGMVSRLQHKKDHKTLLAAFDKLCFDRPDQRLKLYIAGDGATKLDIEEEISKRNLGDRVEMCGVLNNHGVRDLMNRLDIYVHSTFGETMSNSIMQAMAMALPIVASDVDGVENMVGPDFGLLVSPRDVGGLANCMAWFIDHPDQAKDYAARARHKAESEYSILKVVQQYEDAATTMI